MVGFRVLANASCALLMHFNFDLIERVSNFLGHFCGKAEETTTMAVIRESSCHLIPNDPIFVGDFH